MHKRARIVEPDVGQVLYNDHETTLIALLRFIQLVKLLRASYPILFGPARTLGC